MFVPLTELEYDIECSLMRQTVDYYYSKEQLYDNEGEDSPCLAVQVELFVDLLAN